MEARLLEVRMLASPASEKAPSQKDDSRALQYSDSASEAS